MSLSVKTINEGHIETRFFPSARDGVEVGKYEIPLEDFTAMSFHFLRGGFNGWVEGDLPEPIKQFLTNMAATFEYRDGEWVRK